VLVWLLTEYKIRDRVERIKDKTNVNFEVTEPCYARKWNSLSILLYSSSEIVVQCPIPQKRFVNAQFLKKCFTARHIYGHFRWPRQYSRTPSTKFCRSFVIKKNYEMLFV
jgi:hypothetical protein